VKLSVIEVLDSRLVAIMRSGRVQLVLLVVVAIAFTVNTQRYLLSNKIFLLYKICDCLQWMSIPECPKRS